MPKKIEDTLKSLQKNIPSSDEIIAKCKETIEYGYNNPKDVGLALGLLFIGSAACDLDDIADSTELSAIVDVHEFMGS